MTTSHSHQFGGFIKILELNDNRVTKNGFIIVFEKKVYYKSQIHQFINRLISGCLDFLQFQFKMNHN